MKKINMNKTVMTQLRKTLTTVIFDTKRNAEVWRYFRLRYQDTDVKTRIPWLRLLSGERSG